MYPSLNPTIDYLTKIRDYGIEYISKRFYSKYCGTVESNTDPQQQGRVKVSVPILGYLFGDLSSPAVVAQTLPKYAHPSSPFAGDNHGFYFPPEPGSQVWVWFDHGHPTQPHISGGWWNNDGKGKPKPGNFSTIPVEFNSILNATLDNNQVTTINPLAPAITTRGIKTKHGHGILFEDDPVAGPLRAGRETRVEIWTGLQPFDVPGAPPAPAIKNHRIVLSDFLSRILIKSKVGHQTTYDDDPAKQGITTTSVYGHTLKFDDVAKQILLKTKLGHQFLIDDTGSQIMLRTALGNTAVLNDKLQTISVQTPGQQSVTLSDALGSIVVNTPGTATVNATTVNASAQGAATVSAGGLLTLVGQGINVTSTGTAPSVTQSGGEQSSTFTGVVNENYDGGLAQTVTGPWIMETDIGIIGSATATKYFLVDERFLQIFNTHVHLSPGVPPSVLVVPPVNPLSVAPDPAVAPNIDKRLVITQDITAS